MVRTSDKMIHDARHFATIAEEIFAPIYPVIARAIVDQTGVRSGTCLDIGSGPGHLGRALAKLCAEMQVILYDSSAEMLEIAREHCQKDNLTPRVTLRHGKAEKLPYVDGSLELVVSRGSLFFWDDQIQAVNEIFRVLAHGGHAYIGGGFGNSELFTSIAGKMREAVPNWAEKRAERTARQSRTHFATVMLNSKVTEFSILGKDPEIWIHFLKK